jgi:dTDP-4-dehydrorhamnose 3,5-epimerase
MEITQCGIPGLLLLKPKIYKDKRGYFLESFNKQALQSAGIDYPFVQDNQSKSEYGVIRGLHYQMNPKAQTKLVRVLQGTIFDVAVDVRKGSPTFGQWYGAELSDENFYQLLIPKGFAHGFSVLSNTAIVLYKCDKYYAPETEAGIAYNDNHLAIDWKIPMEKALVSEKDLKLPSFNKAKITFRYEQ